MPNNNIELQRLTISNSSSSSISKVNNSSSSSGAETRISDINGESTGPLENEIGLFISYLSTGEPSSERGDIVTLEIDISALPSSLQMFCRQLKLDEAVVIKYLLIDAYEQILQNVAKGNVNEEAKKLFKRFLKYQYVMDKISPDALKIAKDHSWLQDSDIKSIERQKEIYGELFTRPSKA